LFASDLMDITEEELSFFSLFESITGTMPKDFSQIGKGDRKKRF